MFTTHKLKNGARVVLSPYGGTEAATILVMFKVGSRDEDLKVWGGSHFIEHLMFKGTKKRPETMDITRELDQYGAEFNAYTGKDLTAYYVKITAERLPVAVDLLEDMLFHSKFDGKEMAKEKKVIQEEIKMYEENPIMHLEDMLEEAMFDGHVLGRNIAGTGETMTKMKRDDVIKYRDQFYVPENMVVIVSGKVPKDILKLLESGFGKIPHAKRAMFENVYLPGKHQASVLRRQEKPLEQIQVALGFPIPGRAHDDSYAIKVLATILGGTMSSRLFIQVREKRGLCYTVRANAEQYDDVGLLSVRAGLDAKRLPLAAKTIIAELKKMAKDGVTSKELSDAKEHWRGALTLQLEDSSARAEFFGRQELFEGKVETLDARMNRVNAVKAGDIKRVAREYLNPAKMSLAVIGPYKTDAEVLKMFGIK
ncbi:MAG: pitrilysin family protein [Patescibacteria group bacterium]|jgi:predicted Zn-dependent peptidase